MARNYGIGTPNKKTDGTDERSWWEKAKDEGKQIVAGFQGGGSASDPSRGGGATSYTSGFGKGYTAEEKRQEKERNEKQ